MLNLNNLSNEVIIWNDSANNNYREQFTAILNSANYDNNIKIEGTNKSQGKHPAGVIISEHKLAHVCPMTEDKSGDTVAAFDMGDLEVQGHVKFDVLGIDLLSKIMEISNAD